MQLPSEVQETIPAASITPAELAAAIENARDHGIITPVLGPHNQAVAVIAPPAGHEQVLPATPLKQKGSLA